MEPSYFLRQLDIADPSKFNCKRVTTIGDWGKLSKEDQAMVGHVMLLRRQETCRRSRDASWLISPAGSTIPAR
jgi:hypothetical protein